MVSEAGNIHAQYGLFYFLLTTKLNELARSGTGDMGIHVDITFTLGPSTKPLVKLPTESDDLTWDNDPLYQVVKNAKIRKGSLGIEERAKCKNFFDQETDLDHNNGDVTGDKGLKLFCP